MHPQRDLYRAASAPPRRGVVRSLARFALLAWALVAALLAGWGLSQNPFAQPFIARGQAELQAVLARSVAAVATPTWVEGRLQAALAQDDVSQVSLYLQLAKDDDIVLPQQLREAAEARVSQDQSWQGAVSSCLDCALHPDRCPNVTQMALCMAPFQLSPAGDVTTLAEQGWHWAKGEEVDGLDVALAGLGVTATAATVLSLGAAAPVKAGITMLRVAHRGKALSPGLTRALTDAASHAGATERLGAMAADVTRIAKSAPATDVLPILRFADTGEDLTRLARFSEAAGPEARKSLEVLGKARALRLMHRVSDALVMALGGIAALLAQLASLLGVGIKLALRRAARG